MVDPYLPVVDVASRSAGAVIFEHLEPRRFRALGPKPRQLGSCFSRVAKPSESSAIGELTVCPQDRSCIETGTEKVMLEAISGRCVIVFNLLAYSALGKGSVTFLRENIHDRLWSAGHGDSNYAE